MSLRTLQVVNEMTLVKTLEQNGDDLKEKMVSHQAFGELG